MFFFFSSPACQSHETAILLCLCFVAAFFSLQAEQKCHLSHKLDVGVQTLEAFSPHFPCFAFFFSPVSLPYRFFFFFFFCHHNTSSPTCWSVPPLPSQLSSSPRSTSLSCFAPALSFYSFPSCFPPPSEPWKKNSLPSSALRLSPAVQTVRNQLGEIMHENSSVTLLIIIHSCN